MRVRISELRKEKNVSQKELASYLNVSQAQISKYESGVNEPDIGTLIRIADFFKISIDELLGHNSMETFFSGNDLVKLIEDLSLSDRLLVQNIILKLSKR